jgi:hypothetical protein
MKTILMLLSMTICHAMFSQNYKINTTSIYFDNYEVGSFNVNVLFSIQEDNMIVDTEYGEVIFEIKTKLKTIDNIESWEVSNKGLIFKVYLKEEPLYTTFLIDREWAEVKYKMKKL